MSQVTAGRSKSRLQGCRTGLPAAKPRSPVSVYPVPAGPRLPNIPYRQSDQRRRSLPYRCPGDVLLPVGARMRIWIPFSCASSAWTLSARFLLLSARRHRTMPARWGKHRGHGLGRQVAADGRSLRTPLAVYGSCLSRFRYSDSRKPVFQRTCAGRCFSDAGRLA